MNPEEIVALEATKPSYLVDPSKSANTNAMVASVVDLNASSDGMNQAKEDLDASIAKMMAQDDPFMQMMIAIYEVIPGTMLYKEEKLVYDTETFEFVTQLNNHMTKMMDYYSKSADYKAESDVGGPDEQGISTGGSGEDVWGLAAGSAYIAEMEDLKQIIESSDLPSEIKIAMQSAFDKIGVADSSSLWNGLAGPYREDNNGKYQVTVGDDDWTVVYNGNGMTESGYSDSAVRVELNQPAVDSSTTGNLELQTTVNSYSATVEAEYTFDMEQYNTYANTSSQAMKAHIDQVAAPLTRLTHISHA